MSRIKHIQGIFGQTFSALPVVKRHRDGRQQRPCLDPTPMGHTVQSGTSCQGKGHSPPAKSKWPTIRHTRRNPFPDILPQAPRHPHPEAKLPHVPRTTWQRTPSAVQKTHSGREAASLPHKQWKSETGMGPRKSLQTDPTAKRTFSGWTCGQTPLPKEIKTAETTICQSTAAKTPRETGKAPHGPPTWCTTR